MASRARYRREAATDIGPLSVAASRLYLALEASTAATPWNAWPAPDPSWPGTSMEPLLDEAVELFRQLTDAGSAFIVQIHNDVFDLVRFSGTEQSIPRRWPRTPETMPQWHLFSRGEVYSDRAPSSLTVQMRRTTRRSCCRAGDAQR